MSRTFRGKTLSAPPLKVICCPRAVRVLEVKSHRVQVVPHLLFRFRMLFDRLGETYVSIVLFGSRPPTILLNHFTTPPSHTRQIVPEADFRVNNRHQMGQSRRLHTRPRAYIIRMNRARSPFLEVRTSPARGGSCKRRAMPNGHRAPASGRRTSHDRCREGRNGRAPRPHDASPNRLPARHCGADHGSNRIFFRAAPPAFPQAV